VSETPSNVYSHETGGAVNSSHNELEITTFLIG